MAVETAVVETWLYSVLSGDGTLAGLATGGVYSNLAPEGTTYPLVLFAYQGGHDVLGAAGARIMEDLVYQVVGVAKGRSFNAAIADRIDALLHLATGAVTGGQVLACIRQAPFQLTEIDAGVEYRRRGGLYRVIAQGS